MGFATQCRRPRRDKAELRRRRKLGAHGRHPAIESLEGRVVLSVVDLTAVGSSGTINGAIFRQGQTAPAGSGTLESFVRIQQTGTEYGYNTDAARPYTDPILLNGGTGTTATFNRALPLDTVPIVSIGGQAYLDFSLDINQQSSAPLISLDEVQVSIAGSNTVQGYSTDGTYGGQASLVYDMGGSASTWVKLNADLSPGSGGADMNMDIPLSALPDSAFSGANRALPLSSSQYLYVYSHLGSQNLNSGDTVGSANNGYEEWATPALGASASTTATTIYDAATDLAVTSPQPAGISIKDGATVTGTANAVPTGAVTFLFYNDATGSGTPIAAGTVLLNAAGVANYSSIEGPLVAGVYSFVAHYNGDGKYLPSDSPVEPMTIIKRTPTTSTQIINSSGAPILSPYEVPLGTSVRDTAIVTNQSSALPATGTVTYEFFNNLTGTTPAVSTQTVNLNANGSVPDSALQGPLAAGAYSYIAIYSGDGNYNGATSPVEPLTVTTATSTTTTAIADSTGTPIPPPYNVALGTSVMDTATILGQFSTVPATGTVTYEFFNNLTGTAPAISTQTVTLNANGSVPNSALQGPLAAGTYSFVAIYSGDSNYAGSTSDAEPLIVGTTTLAVTTAIADSGGTPIPSPYHVALGTSVMDTATILGQSSTVPATGTVTYEFFNNLTGTGSPVSSQAVTVNSDGTVPNSPLQSSLAAGDHSFVAVYSGDNNYARLVSAPEPLVVDQGTSTMASAITDSSGTPILDPFIVALGTTVMDTATLTPSPAGFTPTGTVTYDFFSTIDGTGTPLTTEVVTLNPDGSVPASPLHGPLDAGAYSFIAVYSGDSNYAGSAGPVEPLTVSQSTQGVTTVIADSTGAPIPSPFIVPLGTTVEDTAAILGQAADVPATGTVTYELFNSSDGTGTPITEVVALNPDGSVPASSLHGPLPAGAYSFVAIYSGDRNYAGSTGAVEPLDVGQGSSGMGSAIVDSAGVPVPAPFAAVLGSVVKDTATLTVSPAVLTPTGTMTYSFAGTGGTSLVGVAPPADWTASPDGLTWTETVSLSGGLVPDSAFTAVLPAGTYAFTTSYSGDANYAASTGDPEPLTVNKGTLGLSTTIYNTDGTAVVGPIAPGSSVYDTAGFSGQVGGFVPDMSGVKYSFNGADAGSGAQSTTQGPLGPGDYAFSVTFVGDSNYNPIAVPVAEPLTVAGAVSSIQTVIVNTNHDPVGTSYLLPVARTNPASRAAAAVGLSKGAVVLDTATVSVAPGGPTPTGTVAYSFTGTNGTSLAGMKAPAGWTVSADRRTWTETVTLNGGTVPDSRPTAALPPGDYLFKASYSGDAHYGGSVSPEEPLAIQHPPGAVVKRPHQPCAQVRSDLIHAAGTSKVTVPVGVSHGKIARTGRAYISYYVQFFAPKSSFQLIVHQAQASPLRPFAVAGRRIGLHDTRNQLIPLAPRDVKFSPTEVKLNLSGLTPGKDYIVGVTYGTSNLVGSRWPFGGGATVYDVFQTTTSVSGIVPKSTVKVPIQAGKTAASAARVSHGPHAAAAMHPSLIDRAVEAIAASPARVSRSR